MTTQNTTTTMTPDLRIRPTSVMSPSITLLCQLLEQAERPELIHYAGASYRDDVAWALCSAWLDDPTATHSELRARAMNATGWGPITAADVLAANPGIDGCKPGAAHRDCAVCSTVAAIVIPFAAYALHLVR